MTEVLYEQIGPRTHSLRARGHATGSPAMCAAVSGLLYALAGYLANAEAEGNARRLEYRMESGDVSLRYAGDGGAAAAFRMALIGLRQLERLGPEYVRVRAPGAG